MRLMSTIAKLHGNATMRCSDACRCADYLRCVVRWRSVARCDRCRRVGRHRAAAAVGAASAPIARRSRCAASRRPPPLEPATASSAEPFPLPPARRRPTTCIAADRRRGRSPRAGAASQCHQGVRRHARQGDRQARLHRLPRRRRRRRPTKEAAHVASALSRSLAHLRQSRSAPTRCSTTNRPSSSASSIPATCASPTSAAAAATPAKCWQVPQEHDDARLHAVGRGPLQQRLRAATSGRASAKATA